MTTTEIKREDFPIVAVPACAMLAVTAEELYAGQTIVSEKHGMAWRIHGFEYKPSDFVIVQRLI